jgi:protein-disulfide isomerase
VQRLAPAQFWDFSAALFEHQTSFFDEAVVDETRNETYKRLARLARDSVGVDEGEVYKLLEVKNGGEAKNAGNAVTGDVKTIVKMARLTGVHVTPTVVFDGVVAGEISSGWTGEQWKEWLGKNVV